MPAANPEKVSPAVKSLKREQDKQARKKKDDQLNEGLEETFPASDPVSVSSTTTVGKPPKEHRKKKQ